MSNQSENIDISIKLSVPKPVNFLRAEGISRSEEGSGQMVDVGDLSYSTVEAMAEAIKQAFIDNADRRRNSK